MFVFGGFRGVCLGKSGCVSLAGFEGVTVSVLVRLGGSVWLDFGVLVCLCFGGQCVSVCLVGFGAGVWVLKHWYVCVLGGLCLWVWLGLGMLVCLYWRG